MLFVPLASWPFANTATPAARPRKRNGVVGRHRASLGGEAFICAAQRRTYGAEVMRANPTHRGHQGATHRCEHAIRCAPQARRRGGVAARGEEARVEVEPVRNPARVVERLGQRQRLCRLQLCLVERFTLQSQARSEREQDAESPGVANRRWSAIDSSNSCSARVGSPLTSAMFPSTRSAARFGTASPVASASRAARARDVALS
jgi:hypothetical protein